MLLPKAHIENMLVALQSIVDVIVHNHVEGDAAKALAHGGQHLIQSLGMQAQQAQYRGSILAKEKLPQVHQYLNSSTHGSCDQQNKEWLSEAMRRFRQGFENHP